MSKEIQLTRGQIAIVDDEDYEWLSKYKWCYVTVGYAARKGREHGGYMHRVILSPPDGFIVDHINRDKLDNRRSNLRLCTQRENQANRLSIKGSSQYKGVIWRKDRGKWRSEIRVDDRGIFLGYYDDEEDAARRYDAAARTAWGSFALTNFDGQEVLDPAELEPKLIPTSIYRGVGVDKRNRKWRVQMNVGGKNHFFGYFQTEIEAAEAYNVAAIQYHGENARLNQFSKED